MQCKIHLIEEADEVNYNLAGKIYNSVILYFDVSTR